MIGFPIGSMDAWMRTSFHASPSLRAMAVHCEVKSNALSAADDVLFRAAFGDGDVAFEDGVVRIDCDLIGAVLANEILDLLPVAHDSFKAFHFIRSDHHGGEIRRQVRFQGVEITPGDGLFINAAQVAEGDLVLLGGKRGQAEGEKE